MGRLKQPRHRQQRLLSELALSFAGRPIVVMGGAPCLLDDLKAIRSAGCWLSANQHGHLARPADFIVCADIYHQVTGRPMVEEMAGLGPPVISPHLWSEIRVADHPQDFPMNSGILALYVAAVLGAHPVIAAGFEFFGGGTYHHDPEAKTNGRIGQSQYVGMADKMTKRAPGVHFQAVSGPLTKVFEPYGASVPIRYDPPRWIARLRDQAPVNAVWHGRTRQVYRERPVPGQTYRLSPDEAGKFHKQINVICTDAEQW